MRAHGQKTFQMVTILAGVASNSGLCYHPVFGATGETRFVVTHAASGTKLPVGLFADERTAQRFIARAAALADWTRPRAAFMALNPQEKNELRQALTTLYETFYLIEMT